MWHHRSWCQNGECEIHHIKCFVAIALVYVIEPHLWCTVMYWISFTQGCWWCFSVLFCWEMYGKQCLKCELCAPFMHGLDVWCGVYLKIEFSGIYWRRFLYFCTVYGAAVADSVAIALSCDHWCIQNSKDTIELFKETILCKINLQTFVLRWHKIKYFTIWMTRTTAFFKHIAIACVYIT